jgi:hypothetical protein
MCLCTRDGCNAFLTTVHAVLADSRLHYFLPREGRDLVHIQQYVSEYVQSCDASKQLLQGEKQQKFHSILQASILQFLVLFTYSLGNYFI